MPGVSFRATQEWNDERGGILEIGRASTAAGPFAQVIRSRSHQGTLRGLHFHVRQSDLWFIERGRIQVALVDLRPDGDLRQGVFEWDADEGCSLFVPSGVAHGYLALTDADMLYCLSREFDPDDEFGIHWNDPQLGIRWEMHDPILSDRDLTNPTLDTVMLPTFDDEGQSY